MAKSKWPRNWPGFENKLNGQLREMLSDFDRGGRAEYRYPGGEDNAWEISLYWVLEHWRPLTPAARAMLAIAKAAGK